MSVVYFHATLQITQITGIHYYPKFGAFGVDIFFVLSGVVMWLTTCSDEGGKPLQFMRKRIIRVAPLYWAVTLAAIAIALAFPSILRSTVFDPSHALASLLFLPWPNPATVHNTADHFSPIVIPGWTLNMEMMFYCLFSLCLILQTKFRTAALSVLLAILYSTGNLSKGLSNPISFYGDLRIFEFLAGVILAAYIVRHLRLSPLIAEVALFLSFVGIILGELHYVELPNAVAIGVPAFLIVTSCLNLERVMKPPNWRLLEELGNASYSIYLTHVFTISGMRVGLNMAGLDVSASIAIAFVPATVLTSAVLGVVVHHAVEKPLFKLASRLFGRRENSLDRPVVQ